MGNDALDDNIRRAKSIMKLFQNPLIPLVLVCLCSSPVFAASSLWTNDGAEESISGLTPPAALGTYSAPGVSWQEYFKKNQRLKNMNLGLRFGGNQTLSRNESQLMLPASLAKIFTAAAALKFLGPHYRFENSFSAALDHGDFTVRNPVFRVSGDPTWGHEAFEGGLETTKENLRSRLSKVLDLLRDHMIRRVQGPIRIESLRPELAEYVRPKGWRDSWKLECMAVMQTEFQANGNCGRFVIHSLGRYGWATDGVSVPVRMKLSKSKEGSNGVRVTPGFDERGMIREYVFTGYFSKGPLVFDLPVHQGADWLRNLFLGMLKDAGIEYDEGPRESFDHQNSEGIEVDLSSRSMLEILEQAVPYSINGAMDRIFLEVGMQNQQGLSVEWMNRMIADLVSNENLMAGIGLQDGSGLNLHNRIRADLLYEFLLRLRGESYFHDFFSSLAVAGKSGTLLNRATLVASSHTYGRIHAKTGTLNGITNLAGYFLSTPGTEPEPFVVLSESDFTAPAARPLIDGIVVNFAAQNSEKTRN